MSLPSAAEAEKKMWTQCRYEECSYFWTLKDFDGIGSVYSDTFESKGRDDIKYKDNLRWKLQLNQDKYDLEYRLTLILVDQFEDVNSDDEDEDDDVDTSWGWPFFARLKRYEFNPDDFADQVVTYKVTCNVSLTDYENKSLGKMKFEHTFVDDDAMKRRPVDYRRRGSWKLPIADLTIEDPKFLVGNELKILCELSYTFPVQDAPQITDYDMECSKMLSALSLDFGDLFSNPKLTDVVLCVGDTQFPCHKVILSVRSPVFAAMFQGDMLENKENRVDIKDLKPEIVNEMLRFIYTGKAPNIENMAHDLLIAADRYDVVTLKALAESKLVSKLSINNVVDELIFSDTYCSTTLKSEATNLMVKHLDEIEKTPEWCELEKKNPGLMNHVLEVADGPENN